MGCHQVSEVPVGDPQEPGSGATHGRLQQAGLVPAGVLHASGGIAESSCMIRKDVLAGVLVGVFVGIDVGVLVGVLVGVEHFFGLPPEGIQPGGSGAAEA